MSQRMMRILVRLSILFCFAVPDVPAHAESEAQSWVQFLSQGKLTQDLRLWAELQPRYSFDRGKMTTVLIRPGLGWQLTPELSVWAGWAWTPLLNPSWRNEHRLWTQAVYAVNLDSVTFTQRMRFETRFIENISDPGLRLRYQVRFSVPVALEDALQLVVYDEVFISLNNPAPSIGSGFDQNRLFVGGFFRVSPHFAFDLGYMWNAVKNFQLATTKMNHVLMTSLYFPF